MIHHWAAVTRLCCAKTHFVFLNNRPQPAAQGHSTCPALRQEMGTDGSEARWGLDQARLKDTGGPGPFLLRRPPAYPPEAKNFTVFYRRQNVLLFFTAGGEKFLLFLPLEAQKFEYITVPIWIHNCTLSPRSSFWRPGGPPYTRTAGGPWTKWSKWSYYKPGLVSMGALSPNRKKSLILSWVNFKFFVTGNLAEYLL